MLSDLPEVQHRVASRPAASGRRPTNWADVERAVVFRLASGVYGPGDRLPTCQEAAADFGVNKNTVAKAYRALVERGYLRTVRGRGTFVVQQPARADSLQSVKDVHGLLGLLLQEAKLTGLNQAQFLELVHAAADQVYQPSRVRVGVVECNAYEADSISRDLMASVGHPMKALVLQDIWADPEVIRERFDVLAVSFAHLHELAESLGDRHLSNQPEIVGLLLSPDLATLTEVARLARGTRVGVVCDVEASAQKLTGLVAAYNTGIHVTTCVTGNERDLRRLLSSVDTVVAGFMAAEHVRKIRAELPVIRVTWNRLDERSVREFAERLAEINEGVDTAEVA